MLRRLNHLEYQKFGGIELVSANLRTKNQPEMPSWGILIATHGYPLADLSMSPTRSIREKFAPIHPEQAVQSFLSGGLTIEAKTELLVNLLGPQNATQE
jgi:hypothetical protein